MRPGLTNYFFTGFCMAPDTCVTEDRHILLFGTFCRRTKDKIRETINTN